MVIKGNSDGLVVRELIPQGCARTNCPTVKIDRTAENRNFEEKKSVQIG